MTASIASRAISSRAMRQLRMGRTASPRITVSGASQASASSVAVTPPSSEFSTGTSARSTVPRSTAITASWMEPKRHELGLARGRGPARRLLAERAGRAQVAQAHHDDERRRWRSPTSGASPASAARIASSSSGESSSSARPPTTCLAYRRA